MPTGAFDRMNIELCEVISSTFHVSSGHLKTVDLRLHVFEKVPKTANEQTFPYISGMHGSPIRYSIFDVQLLIRSRFSVPCRGSTVLLFVLLAE